MRDPFRVRYGALVRVDEDRDEGEIADEGVKGWDGRANEDGEGDGGEGEEDWIWEAEEDFTVGHVWPEGGDLKRGCVYVSALSSIFFGQVMCFSYFFFFTSLFKNLASYILRPIQSRLTKPFLLTSITHQRPKST